MAVRTDVFTTTIAPSIGLALNFVMWYAPYQSVAEVRRTKKMGSLNPYPFIITLVNCVGWILYGCMIQNAYVAVANLAGATSFAYYFTSTFPYATREEQENIEVLLLAGIIFWSVIGLIVSCVYGYQAEGFQQACMFVGYIGAAFGIAFYAAGLTKMWEIIVNRDSSSIHIRSCVINVVNAALWTFYGKFGLNNVNIYVPNLLGFILSVIQLLFVVIFPRKQLMQQERIALATREPGSSIKADLGEVGNVSSPLHQL